MASRVVLHIGLMKSGTSSIQARMVAGRATLAEHGVLFPGSVWRDQVVAVSDALGRRRRAQGEFDGAWSRMVEEIGRYDGVAVISMEFLAAPSAEKLAAVVDAFAGTPVQVVLTVRDLGRALPSMWQETLKNGRTWTWRDYQDATRQHDSRSNFWREQDAGAIAAKWSGLVGAEQVAVVTLPHHSGPTDVLWERFCLAAGIRPEAAAPLPRANESLGAASADLLRRVNLAIGSREVPWPAYSRVVKFGLAKSLLADHRASEAGVGFKPPRWLHAEAKRMRAQLRDSGARIVGDLADLAPVASPGVDPDRIVPGDDGAAVHAIAGLVRRELDRYLAAEAPVDA